VGRRGKGEGSIYRRGDGTWVASLDLGYIDGKRKRKVAYAKTRREAAAKLKELQRQVDEGVNLAAERQTVEQFLTYWLTNHVQGIIADSTAKLYSRHVRVHLVPALGHLKLDKLSSQHIQSLLTGLRDTHKPGTIGLVYSVLHAALEKAVRLGLLLRNPASNVDVARTSESVARAITPDDEAAIFALMECENHRLLEMVRIAIKIGMRQGEMTALKWADVDLGKGEIRIKRGKTPRSRRTISISTELVAAFQRQWEFQTVERQACGLAWQEHGLVFPSAIGTPLRSQNIDDTWHRIQRRAGINEHYRWHDLRHTAATRLAEANVHPRVTMEILGQANIATTMEIYTHVSSDVQREALEKISKLGS
jgi:integrase